MCEASLGLSQGEESARPGKQAVLHPRRADGPRLRQGEDQGLLYVEVPEGAPQQPRLSENSWGLLLVFKPTTGTALLLEPTLTVHCNCTISW